MIFETLRSNHIMNMLSTADLLTNTWLRKKGGNYFFTTVFCLLLLPAQAFSFNGEEIEVTGQGSILVIPDQFSLTLTITERGRIPSKLKALVDKKSDTVVSTARNLSIKEAEISSARVNLRIVEEQPSIVLQGVELNQAKQGSVFIDGQSINQQANSIEQHKKPLFELSRQITVNFNKISDYDNFLAQVIKINVSHISSLLMSVEGREEYYQQALMRAIAHAKQKAQRMAEKAGRKIGKLQLIKELSNNHYRPMYAEAMMSDITSNGHSSQSGSQTITARVLVKYHLDD
jgi:uncharacterized protein YggE